MSTVPFPLALTPPPRKSSGYISPFSSRAPFPYIIGRRRPLAPASCVLPYFETFLSREPLSSLAAACFPPLRDDGPPFCISTSCWQIGPRRSGSEAPCLEISPEKSSSLLRSVVTFRRELKHETEIRAFFSIFVFVSSLE